MKTLGTNSKNLIIIFPLLSILLFLLVTFTSQSLLSFHFIQSALAFKPSASPSEPPTPPQTPASNTTSSPSNQGSGEGNTSGLSVGCGPGTDNSTCTQSSNSSQSSTPSDQSGGASSNGGGFGTSPGPSGGGMPTGNGFGSSSPSTAGNQQFGPDAGANNQGGFGNANGGQTGGFSNGPANGGISPSMGNSGNNANTGGGESGYSNQPGNQPGTIPSGSSSSLRTYNIPSLGVRLQAPADSQSNVQCSINHTCSATFVSANNKFTVQSSSGNLNQLNKEEVKDSDFPGVSNIKSIKTVLSGQYPAYIITWKLVDSDKGGSISRPMVILVGNLDNSGWLRINFEDSSDGTMPIIQGILNSITSLQNSAMNNG